MNIGFTGPTFDVSFRNLFLSVRNIWTLKNIQLADGDVKFRFNNDWTFNYGVDKKGGNLKAEGQNIQIKAGFYDISLDLTDPNRPKFTIIKQN